VPNIVRGQCVSEERLQLARELRRELTPQERILWDRVRGQRLGFKFRRQQVIRGFVVDFYCHRAALVVEVDGAVHADQEEYDASRADAFNQLGIEVIRFYNSEVSGDLEEVLRRIRDACERRGVGSEGSPT
jgi:very-short-patch-repair endonuclease